MGGRPRRAGRRPAGRARALRRRRRSSRSPDAQAVAASTAGLLRSRTRSAGRRLEGSALRHHPRPGLLPGRRPARPDRPGAGHDLAARRGRSRARDAARRDLPDRRRARARLRARVRARRRAGGQHLPLPVPRLHPGRLRRPRHGRVGAARLPRGAGCAHGRPAARRGGRLCRDHRPEPRLLQHGGARGGSRRRPPGARAGQDRAVRRLVRDQAGDGVCAGAPDPRRAPGAGLGAAPGGAGPLQRQRAARPARHPERVLRGRELQGGDGQLRRRRRGGREPAGRQAGAGQGARGERQDGLEANRRPQPPEHAAGR